MTAKLWKKLGLSPFVELQINSIGSASARGHLQKGVGRLPFAAQRHTG